MEDVSTSAGLVVRYVQAHRLWEDHPNPAIDSLETLLGTVDGIQYIQAAAVVGASSQSMRARTAVLIEQHWGPTWFEQIPADMKDPTWMRACDCSHQLLRLVAANAKQGLTFEDVRCGWAESMSHRRDERMRCPPYGTDDGWRPSKDGKWLLKRVGKQMVRKPVESRDERRDPSTGSVSSLGDTVASSRDGTPNGNRELQVIMCSLPDSATNGTETGLDTTDKSTESTDRSKCEGRRVAALLRHQVDTLSTETVETPSMMEIAGRCCDTCRTDVAKLGGLVGDFTRIAKSLESVSQHLLSGVDIGLSQPPGAALSTPHRERRQHRWLPVADDSDDD